MDRLLRCVVLAVVGLCAFARSATAHDDPQANANGVGAVVSGEVITVENVPGGGTRATVKIVHVYYGPKALKGLGLFDYTADIAFNPSGLAIPLLKVGEQGIWLMGTDQNTDTLRVVHRYRKDHTANYDRRVDWAVEFEQLYKLDVTKRLKLAQELCGRKTPEVAQLGIEVLFHAKPDDAERAGVSEFFKELPKNRDVTHSALVRADRLFEHRDGKQWIGSDPQKALFARFTEVLTEADSVEVANHILSTCFQVSPNGNSLTPQEAAALFVKVATDPRQSKAVRNVFVNRVVEYANNAGVKVDFTFEVLTAVVRHGGDNALRLVAAKGLARFKWNAAAQLDELRALLKDEKDVEIVKALKSALDKSK